MTREKLLSVRNHKHFNLGLTIVIILLVFDLLFLNIKILSLGNPVVSIFQQKTSQPPTASSQPANSDSCGQECMAEINKAVSAAVVVEKNTASNTPVYGGSASSVQEYFIPLGSGMISSPTLTTVSGMQATIDSGAYGSGYTATFEITVSIPTGNQTASFQLYDSTQNHPVWNSSVNFTGGGTPQLLISSPITLDPGSNTYIVQGSTQLQFPAYITQARVHIITQ